MGTAHPAKILLNVHSFSALYGFLLFNGQCHDRTRTHFMVSMCVKVFTLKNERCIMSLCYCQHI